MYMNRRYFEKIGYEYNTHKIILYLYVQLYIWMICEWICNVYVYLAKLLWLSCLKFNSFMMIEVVNEMNIMVWYEHIG